MTQYLKTCISLECENMKTLNRWVKETGLTKSAIINHLINEVANNGAHISVTYDLKRKESSNE